MFSTNPVPRVAAIHDLSSFGRASLTVVTPILSSMGVQVCPLPTAVLSTHTGGFQGYHFVDLTAHLRATIAHWKDLGVEVDAIYSGFLGSPQQVDLVTDLIESFGGQERLVVVDPVMGDDGKPYSTMGPELIAQMRRLITRAHVITPNFTEAAFLLEEDYSLDLPLEEAKSWARRLVEMGPNVALLTSVPLPEKRGSTAVLAYDGRDHRFWKIDCNYIPAHYPGTGDAFASVIVGSLLCGDSLPIAMDRAVQFVSMAIRATFGHPHPPREGVLLERVLGNLNTPVTSSTYELLE